MCLKVLFLSHKFYPDIGGIETLSEIFANQLSKAGHNVHLVTWSSDSTKKEFAFTVIRTPGVKRLLQEHSWADLVFENNICMRLSWPSIVFRRPAIIGLQTWITGADNKVSFKEQFKYKWLGRAAEVVACSTAIQKRCWPNASVIGNPYQEEIFRIVPEIQRTLEFVFLGRLVSDKGADMAIEAFYRILTEKGNNIKAGVERVLTIIGDGPELSNLQSMVRRLGIQNSVVFRGALRDELLVKCLNQHHFLLVPSTWEEPFGIVALEGMACGCVPIVSDGGGLPDAVGDAGLVFKRGDVDSLVEAIKKLYTEPLLVEQLRVAAPAHLKNHQQTTVYCQYYKLFAKHTQGK
jgi:glycosyltransferase involved in cell wall biosynthesis